MSVAILSSPRARHQLDHQEALYEGLTSLGIPCHKTLSLAHTNGSAVACWGWRNGKILRDRGFDVLVMERGYIGDRFSYSSLAWNGLNGHAEFPVLEYDGGERFNRLGIELKPWRERNSKGYALILGQVPKDASLNGVDMIPWYEQKATEAKEHYGCDVFFRPHPDLKRAGINQRIKGAENLGGTLEEALDGAAFTICFNSNSAVNSIVHGVRCVAGDRGTMAYEMCSTTVKILVARDRTLWAARLAHRQWTLDEIRSGEALKGHLCKLGA